MPYTYTTFVTNLSIEAVQLTTDPNWSTILSTIIDDSEQRCYRDLGLLATIVRDNSAALTANSRNFTLPQDLGRFVTVRYMSVLAGPSGRIPLVPVSQSWLDWTWPSEAAPSTPSYPKYFSPLTDQNFLFGPAPDSGYQMEVTGTIRPTPLSAANPTTFLTLYLSDLFFAGAMSSAAGYMRNFGSQADDPKMSASWEMQYAQRLSSAKVEELQRKFASGDWTPEMPVPPAVSLPR